MVEEETCMTRGRSCPDAASMGKAVDGEGRISQWSGVE